MDWKTELGRQIREGRRDSHLNQEELSRMADVHMNMIGRYERGESAPDLNILIRLASELEIEEFSIGEYLVSIRPAQEERRSPGRPKQMRLEYGKEYVFDGGNSSVKIQPSKEGLFITPEHRKTSA